MLENSPVDELTRDQAQQELHRLKDLIQYHDELYFGQANPEISDATYDELVRQNRAIEARYPDLRLPDSPSIRIGAPPSEGFKKVLHRRPMLSLENAFSREDVEDFIKRIQRFLKLDLLQPLEFFGEPKIDGLSVSIHYQDGKMVLASTRGDGAQGEDITENIRTLEDVPLTLQSSTVPESLEVRGEVYIRKSDFAALNVQREEKGEPPFANPRNAAAGSLRQLDSSITASRPLKFFAYHYDALSGSLDTTQEVLMARLQSWGFSVSDKKRLCQSVDEMMTFYNDMLEGRRHLDYEIDGIVYKLNDFEWQRRLGSVGRTPRHSLAHKFPAEQAESVIEKIAIQVGRTGVLTPVAHLRPTVVGGVTVSRASLHNEDEIKRKDIREGDTVIIQRAGDVIPQVVEVLPEKRPSSSRPFIFPETCPICQSPAVRIEDEVARRCSGGLVCSAQMVEHLRHFVSRNAFNIEGFGARHIESFFKDGLIQKPVDIFRLERLHGQDIRNREGWGTQSAANLFKAIEERRAIPFNRFIYALGIRQVGEVTAKQLATYYGTIETFLQKMKAAVIIGAPERAELVSLDGIGDNMAQDLISFFSNQENIKAIQDLLEEISVQPAEVIVAVDSPITGKSIVFTGTLHQMSRQEAKAIAERLGAKVIGTVSAKTDFIVVGDDAGSKAQKARELGVSVLSEDDWLKIVR